MLKGKPGQRENGSAHPEALQSLPTGQNLGHDDDTTIRQLP